MGSTGSIGIFDSGVGGLTVVKALLNKLPDESFIYIGDTAHVPYGNKTEEQLFSYAHAIISFLISCKVKAIIVACGTHSSVTLPYLERDYDIPMLGVVKAGARAAGRATRKGNIGVIATQPTVNSHAYSKHIKEIYPDAQVTETACSRFVPLVETGKLEGTETNQVVKEYLTPLVNQGIDTLVMGCTHYPFLAPAIGDFVGEKITLVDPAYETIDEMSSILASRNLLAQDNNPTHEFYVSGNDDSFYNVGKLLIGDIIKTVKKINID